MRLNSFVAQATGLSRRKADDVIRNGRIVVNGDVAKLGDQVDERDKICLDDHLLSLPIKQTIILNKPKGYVVSRNGQGSKTIYDLLPTKYWELKPIGRLDKDSSGLLLLTNDGELAHSLTHPSHNKQKIYEVSLNRGLTTEDEKKIAAGVELEDGMSRLNLSRLSRDRLSMIVVMSEGRNRQIRRTFAQLGYMVSRLHRTRFGDFGLEELPSGKFKPLNSTGK